MLKVKDVLTEGNEIAEVISSLSIPYQLYLIVIFVFFRACRNYFHSKQNVVSSFYNGNEAES